MNRHRIIEILESYRPGEDLESDPEVREALAMADSDPELAGIRRQAQAFDDAFAEAFAKTEVPESLKSQILKQSPAKRRGFGQTEVLNPILRWIHPASFAAAAAIIILLALSFTFWNRPLNEAPPLALSQDPISATAATIYASLNPSFKSRDGSEIRDYLQSRNSATPVSLPGDILWDETFACDVVEVEGHQVSIVCFKAPDQSRSMHLFTFLRSEFPGVDVPTQPRIQRSGGACCATWADGDRIHVLYSDKGEKNLRTILDI